MVQDLKDFLEKINEDEALQERMDKIIKDASEEEGFDNCNALAKELGYTITQEDWQTLADEYQEDLSDEELDKVAGGTMRILIELTKREFIRLREDIRKERNKNIYDNIPGFPGPRM